MGLILFYYGIFGLLETLEIFYNCKSGSVVKNLPGNAGDLRDVSSIPGSGRSPRVGNGNLLQLLFLPKFGGQRSLIDYSLWGHKQLDTTEHDNGNNVNQDTSVI